MPDAFQVLTRALQALCRHIISGLCYWYVDDLMAVSHKGLYINDSTIVDQDVQQLLGSGSIATARSMSRVLGLGFQFGHSHNHIVCAKNEQIGACFVFI